MKLSSSSYNRWLYLLIAPPLVLATLVVWLSVRLTSEAQESELQAELVREAGQTLSALISAETGQRGFVITGAEEYLEPYRDAQQELPGHLMRLAELTVDSPTKAKSASRVEILASQKMAELAEVIELRRQRGFIAAEEIVAAGTGKQIMDEIRKELDRIELTGTAELQESHTSRQRFSAGLWAISGLGILVTGVGLLGLYRIGAAQEQVRSKEKTEGLERMNHDLEEFAQMAAHDLRSPSRTALSLLQLARRRLDVPLPADHNHLFEQVEESLRRQMSLIDSLMIYQRIGRSEMPVAQPVPLQEPIDRALRSLQHAIANAGAEVKYHNLPTVEGHVEQLSLLFQNLIENGVKYRRPGVTPHIEIAATLSREDWVISISDNGMGFEREYAEKIFQPFERLHGSNIAGSGIGLATCVRIVERHRGRIWATSQPGQGSEFFVALPKVSSTGPTARETA